MIRKRRSVGGFVFFMSLCSILMLFSAMASPASAAATEIIIDNGGAGTSYTGTWAASGGLNPYGKDSVYGRGGATYTWKASLPQTGTYEVYAWWTEYSSRSTNAPLKITYSGGADTVRVNQQVNGGQWNYLGTYSFSASAGGTVLLTAESPSPVSYSADAVKFVLVSGANQPPTAVIDSISPNPAQVGDTVTLKGHGTDSDGTVTGYNWRSSIDGNLGTTASLAVSTLSEGVHTIYFRVQDNTGAWSPEVSTDLIVSGQTSVEVIIDNGGAGTSYTGTWAVSGAPNPYGRNSLYSRVTATYTWHTALPQTGTYEVYAWWTEYSSRSTNAPLKITYSGGADTVRVNQQVNGGQWNYLGTYSFDAAKGGTVTLTAGNAYSDSFSADAVKFVLVSGANQPPTAVIDSVSPNPAQVGDTVTLKGHGTDSDGTVTGYSWRSSIDGALGTTASLSTAGLSEGTHTVFFKVKDDAGDWSPEVSETLVVSPSSTPVEIIIDNGGAGTSYTGLWAVSGAPNPYGKDSLYSRETATYTWHADLPQAGAYEVYMWWTEYPSRSDNAPVTVRYDSGSDTIRVNQQVNGGQWNYLGTYSFDAAKGGTVTLTAGNAYSDSFSADAVKFVYTDQPFIGIIQPDNYDLQGSTSLTVKAEARNMQGGWKVKFVLDKGTSGEKVITDGTDPYEVTFTGVPKSEHTLDAFLLDAADKEVPGDFTHDRKIRIGIGDYYVAIGDSITYGDSDDYPQDDISSDGRNSGGGYEPILNNLQTAYHGYPQTVINEGVDSTRSYDGASSVGGILAKHPNSKYFLIMYGTNDSASKIPSGLGLQPGSQGYTNSYKDYMQRIITAVLGAGKIPVIAKIPIVYGDCPTCAWYTDPQNAARNVLIRDYNKVIDELVKANRLTIKGPDMYSYFSVHPEELSDTTHPDGIGYQSMADLWYNALP